MQAALGRELLTALLRGWDEFKTPKNPHKTKGVSIWKLLAVQAALGREVLTTLLRRGGWDEFTHNQMEQQSTLEKPR